MSDLPTPTAKQLTAIRDELDHREYQDVALGEIELASKPHGRLLAALQGIKRQPSRVITKHGGPGPHESGTQQSIHGNWSRGLSATQRHTEATTRGGFTVHVPSGKTPTSGWAVAVPGHEETFPLSSFSASHVAAYRRTHAAALRDPATSWGAWVDDESGQVFLDISIVVDSEHEATSLGKQYDQLAIYNLATGKEKRL